MSDTTTPIYVSPEQDLVWSQDAPALTFRTTEGGWQMGDNFRLQHLRLKIEEKGEASQTLVHRDKQGRVYYLPHWPLFTALVDAKGDAETAQAARALASLSPKTLAPELGFQSPIAFYLVVGKAPSPGDLQSTREWRNEHTFLSYWAHLSKAGKQEAIALRTGQGEWGLLDVALRSRQFLVAETLWQAGARFSPALAKQGVPAWALTEGLLSDITSYEATTSSWASKRIKTFLQKVIEEEQVPGQPPLIGSWRDHPGNMFAMVALVQRWLRRMKEDGVNFNATVEVKTVESEQRSYKGHWTPFMQALKRSITQDPAERKVWARAMLDGTYDLQAKVIEPFELKGSHEGSIADFASQVCPDEEVNAWILEAFLKGHLSPASRPTLKTRL